MDSDASRTWSSSLQPAVGPADGVLSYLAWLSSDFVLFRAPGGNSTTIRSTTISADLACLRFAITRWIKGNGGLSTADSQAARRLSKDAITCPLADTPMPPLVHSLVRIRPSPPRTLCVLCLADSTCLSFLAPPGISGNGSGSVVIPYTKGPDSTNKRIIEFDTLANSVIDVEFNGRCTPNYGWL